MKALDFRAPAASDELDELAAIIAWAFNDAVENSRRRLGRLGLEDIRIARRDGRIVGGLVQIPMGQWFGGQSVPMLGIAGVVVAASARGSGVALGMMERVLRDARARGFGLSTLYPSTFELYRKAGYELAGSYCRSKLRLADCPRERSECELREVGPEDQQMIEQLYTRVARGKTGYLDRGSYVWDRVREHPRIETHGVVVHGPSGLEGYAFLAKQAEGVHHDLKLTDFVSVTRAASARLLDFVAAHRSTVDHALWYGSVADDRLLALSSKGRLQVEVEEYWMLRIVDVERALSMRGYPELEHELTLSVSDPVLPENSGAYRLALNAGRARVTRIEGGEAGKAGGVRLDVRALSALYTGFVTVSELAHAGAIVGDARSLAMLAGIFSGPAPALCDYF